MQLYKVKDEETYGILLATASDGKLVLEVNLGKERLIKDYPPEMIEKVLPYTIKTKTFKNDNLAYDYFIVPKGVLELGDFFVNSKFQLFQVIALDIKTEGAKNLESFTVFQTKALKVNLSDSEIE